MTHRREKERKTGDMKKDSETEGKEGERKDETRRERDRSRRVIVRQKALP